MADVKIYLEENLPETELLRLEDEFWNHYLNHVRRLEPGAEVEVAGPEEVLASRIVATEPLEFEIKSRRLASRPGYEFWLVQSLTRKKRIEDSIKRATELGATHFLPVISKHTVRRPNNPAKQRDRWRRIALDSTRVTGRDWTPQIFEPVDFENFREKLPESTELFWGEPGGAEPGEVFPDSSDSVAFVVGPEGDFSSSEKQKLRDLGACSVTLGPSVLRSGTAAIAFSTLWLHYKDFLAVD